jgi:uncharacterized membrane protein
MSELNHEEWVSPDTTRAEAFSDGVLAIIITLLVLDLRVPPHQPGSLLPALLHQWPTYLAYVTSYLYIAVVWLNHKAAFFRIRALNRPAHWANLLVLFTTALLPWPTSVLADAVAEENRLDAKVAVGLYALVGALLCASWLLFFHVLSRHPELLESGVERNFFAHERPRALIGTVLYIVAGVVGVLEPFAAFIIFLAVPLFYALTSHGYTDMRRVLLR